MDLERIEVGAFCGMRGIQKLNLDNNKLASLPELCSLKCCLVVLNVRNNIIIRLSKSFLKGFKKLQKIILSFNKLSVLPDVYWIQHSLSDLVANTNKIQSLDALQTNGIYIKLKYLSVYDNDIRHFNVSLLRHMPKLNAFYIHANNLTHIDEVRSLDIGIINLKANPWHCGEELSWMGEEDFGFERGLTCATPACLHGMAIADMSKSIQCGADITRLFFLLHSHNRHSIARLWGRGMECILCVPALIYVVPHSM